MLNTSRTARHAVASAIALAAAIAPCVAAAQTPPTPPPTSPPPAAPSSPESATTLVEAQRRLNAGLALFRELRYPEAIHQFELANSAAPSADIWYNIARAYELMGQFASAADNYQRYLRDKVDPPDRAAVEALIRELRRRVDTARTSASLDLSSRVAFVVQPRGATVYLNGVAIGTTPIAAERPVPAGNLDVRVTAPGMQEWRSTVRVAMSRYPAVLHAQLVPATRYRTITGGHLASYILGGVGIAGLGVGLGLGIVGLTHPACGGNDATGMLADGCVRGQFATAADASFGIGAAFLLSAAIAYFVEASSSHTERVTAAPSN